MRCRRVRSCLSVYCKDELAGRRHRAVAEHLEECLECRREEAVFRELNGKIVNMPQYGVSADFNDKILDRIARERFKETRTRAYFPKRVPVLGWGRLVPALATMGLVLAFVFYGGLDILKNQNNPDRYADISAASDKLDDRYKEAQPEANHVFLQHARSDWAFKKQVARVERIRNLTNRLAGQNYFTTGPVQYANNYAAADNRGLILRLPFDRRTLNRTYTSPQTLTAEEVH